MATGALVTGVYASVGEVGHSAPKTPSDDSI